MSEAGTSPRDSKRAIEDVALDERFTAADAAFHECVEAAVDRKPVAAYKAEAAYLKAVCAVLAKCVDGLARLALPVRHEDAEERHDLHGMVSGKPLPRVKKLHDLALRLYSKRALRLYLLELSQAKRMEVQRVFLEIHDLPSMSAVLQQVADKFHALEECAKRRCDFGDCHGSHSFL